MQVTYKPGADAPYLARVLRKRDGFSKDYRWDRTNGFTVEMEAEDADKLRQTNPTDAADFAFADQPKGK
jgi:hypothetical protein